MPATVVSPLMNITVPVVLTATGPGWATNLFNALFTTIDGHDHSSGKGTFITPLGMNINADLTFAGFNATNLRSSRYASQAVPLALGGDVGCISNVLGNLYWNNGSGTAVQLTSGSSILAPNALGAPLTHPVRAITTTYTIDSSGADYELSIDSTGGAFALTLPVATQGREIWLTDKTGQLATNNVTLTRRGAENINNVGANKVLSAAFAMYRLVCLDGTNWWIRGV